MERGTTVNKQISWQDVGGTLLVDDCITSGTIPPTRRDYEALVEFGSHGRLDMGKRRGLNKF